MRCMHCGADILPCYIAAIQNNTCPACADTIYNDETKTLIEDLSSALEKMPNDPQGIAGWLVSNYRFQKMGDGIPTEKFYRKGGSQSNFDESQMKMDPTYNQFMKRGEASEIAAKSEKLAKKFKGAKGEKFAKMAAAIQGVTDPYGDDPLSTIEEEDDEAPLDKDDIKAYEELQRSGVDPFAEESGSVVSRGGKMTDLSQAIDPSEVRNLLKITPDTLTDYEKSLETTAEGRAILQRERFKKAKSQDAISSSGGAFRR